ncbi:fibronectin type III domain-containing protein [Corynebacterium gallinarum]|uniref:Fibronectin type-III domain-containing protein n=1 Tax=Corynebacterium gallinarum TaxID=2762214 RepID=A0A8I0HR44_9CORY|nr:hypothetical protein [Corynebacterium gallinarum]MBD8030998.1 hypothetical protein [Corynebacterium gallinarum]
MAKTQEEFRKTFATRHLRQFEPSTKQGLQLAVLLDRLEENNWDFSGDLQKALSGFNLAQLFWVTADMDKDQVSTQLMWVDMALNNSQNPLPVRVKGLKDRLKASRGGEWSDELVNLIMSQAQTTGQEILDRLLDRARKEADGLGVFPRARLEELRATYAEGYASEDVEAHFNASGLKVVEPYSPLPGDVPPWFHRMMNQDLNMLSLIALVFFDQKTIPKIPVLERCTLSRDQLAEAKDRVNKGHGTGIHTDQIPASIDLIMREYPTDEKLRDLLRLSLQNVAAKRLAGLSTPVEARDDLVDRGVEITDASRIVLALISESVPGKSSEPTWGMVLAALAGGRLREARQLADQVESASAKPEDDSERGKALDRLNEHEQKVASLVEDYHRAFDGGDVHTALTALKDAERLCTDDPDLQRMVTQLPPGPPRNVSAQVLSDHKAVQLSWSAGINTRDSTQHQVSLQVGDVPEGTTNGTVLASRTTEFSFLAPVTEVGETLHFGVSSTNGGGWSAPSWVEVVVAPPVSNVRVVAEETAVNLTWEAHPAVTAVRVSYSGAGTEKKVTSPQTQGITISDLQHSESYRFVLTAEYTSRKGGTFRSEPVSLTAVPRGRARPVKQLTHDFGRGPGGQSELSLYWSTLRGYDIYIYALAHKCPYGFGERVPLEDLKKHGTRMTGTALQRGTVEGLKATPKSGEHIYVPVTIDGTVGVIGQSTTIGFTPSLTNVAFKRLGNTALISWEWPQGVNDVEAKWSGPHKGQRMISRTEYQKEGGLRIDVGATASRLTLSAVAFGEDTMWMSQEKLISIPAIDQVVTYVTAVSRNWRNRPKHVDFCFSVSPASAGLSFTFIPVLGVGQYPPAHPTVNGAIALDPVRVKMQEASEQGANTRAHVRVSLDGRGEFRWVRAFTEDSGVLLENRD